MIYNGLGYLQKEFFIVFVVNSASELANYQSYEVINILNKQIMPYKAKFQIFNVFLQQTLH